MKQNTTIGIDLGDKKHVVCVLDKKGQVVSKETVINTEKAMKTYFSTYKKALVVMESGTHSPWTSRLLQKLGHHVIVGNTRKVKAIWSSDTKSDENDAEMLGRMGRFDPSLLRPIQHRGKEAQEDLALTKARDQLIKVRTQLINHVRGSVKALGGRIRKCGTACFHKRALEDLPLGLGAALIPVIETIGELTERIKKYDEYIERVSNERYPETAMIRQIPGVGAVTALAYVLTLEEPGRFRKNRSVGAFLGLVPRRDQSGECDKQLRITKAGNGYVRRLLVSSAQYILGPFGPDSDLRRFGHRLSQRGGKNAKRRAVVAVARKLAVLLYVLWSTGAVYDPLYKEKRNQKEAA